jgi:hypothetical protein
MRSALTIQFHLFDLMVTVFAFSLALLFSFSYFAQALPINSTYLRNNQKIALEIAIIGDRMRISKNTVVLQIETLLHTGDTLDLIPKA